MSDFLTSLVRRERGLARQDAVAPRLPGVYEEHADLSEALEEIRTVEAPAVVSAVAQPPAADPVEGAAHDNGHVPDRRRPNAPRDGERTLSRPGETVTPLHVVEPSPPNDRVEMTPGRAAPRPTTVRAAVEPHRVISTSPAPETTTPGIEERVTVLTHVDVREVDMSPRRAARDTPRVEPAANPIEPRQDTSVRTVPTQENARPTIHVTIGRIDVRAVTAEPPVQRPATAPSQPPMGLDEYLERRNRGRLS